MQYYIAMKRQSILVVDDDPDILEAIRFLLEDAGYQVTTREKCGNLQAIQSLCPNLIILDVLLSGEDGRDIAKKLKKLDGVKHIPIIMVSAHPSAGKTAFEAGANDFIAKPFDVDDLLKRVDKWLNNN